MASHSSELEAQVCKLSQELAEYKAESTELKNQDGTIRRLEERVRSLEAQVQEKVSFCKLISSMPYKFSHKVMWNPVEAGNLHCSYCKNLLRNPC